MTAILDPKTSRRPFVLSKGRDMIELVSQWRLRVSGRRELLHLNTRLREDIAIRYEDAWQEQRKWFWRP